MKGNKKFIFLFFILALGKVVGAQHPVIWEPEAVFSFGINERWSGNGKVVLRYPFGMLGSEGQSVRFRNSLLEGQGFVNYRLVGGHRLTLGLLYGVTDPWEVVPRPEFRIIEQYSFRTLVFKHGFSHRLRFEQRFRDKDMQQRMRYRITSDFPLQGSRIDPGEFYVIAGTELLFSFEDLFESGSFDNRTGAGLGYQFLNKQRLQFEIQGRFTRMGTERKASAVHLLTSYIFSL